MNLLLPLWSLPILTCSQLTFCVWLCLTGDKTFSSPASAIRNIFVSLSRSSPPICLMLFLDWKCLSPTASLCWYLLFELCLALRSNQCGSMENKVEKTSQWKYLCHFPVGWSSWGFLFLVEEALSDPFSALSDHTPSTLLVIPDGCYGDSEFLSPEVWVLRLPETIWAWPSPCAGSQLSQLYGAQVPRSLPTQSWSCLLQQIKVCGKLPKTTD